MHEVEIEIDINISLQLTRSNEKSHKPGKGDLRHAQHVNQMLFREIPLFADIPLQGRKDFRPLQQRLPGFFLQAEEFLGWGPIGVYPGGLEDLGWETLGRRGR